MFTYIVLYIFNSLILPPLKPMANLPVSDHKATVIQRKRFRSHLHGRKSEIIGMTSLESLLIYTKELKTEFGSLFEG